VADPKKHVTLTCVIIPNLVALGIKPFVSRYGVLQDFGYVGALSPWDWDAADP